MQNCVFIVVVLASVAWTLPLETPGNNMDQTQHDIQKRFVNPLFSLSAAENERLSNIRTKRSEEECEKLQLCKLHARANRNFFSSFQLYFVNKENAKLWDHQTHSLADCEERYGDECY